MTNNFWSLFLFNTDYSRFADGKESDEVGYGVRPSERKKGYASLMLKLLLTKIREFDSVNKKKLEKVVR